MKYRSYLIDLDVDRDINVQNRMCIAKIMSICNKQHLSNILVSIH